MAGEKILIADDEPYNVRALSYILKREGYDVQTAVDGEDAVMKFEAFRPQVVFIDLMMPKKNGFEVTHTLRNDPRYRESSPYIIILTGKGEDTEKFKGYLEGGDEYITKPFSPVEIIGKMREYFQQKRD